MSAQPLLTQETLRALLQDGIAKGLWTLEDLDTPSPGYMTLWADNASHLVRFKVEQPFFKNPLRSDETPQLEPTVEPPQPTAAATPDNDDLFNFDNVKQEPPF